MNDSPDPVDRWLDRVNEEVKDDEDADPVDKWLDSLND